MEIVELDHSHRADALKLMSRLPFFKALSAENIEKVFDIAECVRLVPDEYMVRQGEKSDSFFVMLEGRLKVYSEREGGGSVLLGNLDQPSTVGEIGLILGKPRTASVKASVESTALRFRADHFFSLFNKVPNFARGIMQSIANRLDEVSEQIPLPTPSEDEGAPDVSLARLLPAAFMERHRIIPVRMKDNQLVLGCVDQPTSSILHTVFQMLPGREVLPVRVSRHFFDQFMQAYSGLGIDDGMPEQASEPKAALAETLEMLMQRMVAEGASDLHLAARCRPRWRLNGELQVLRDAPQFSQDEIYQLVEPILEDRHKEQFDLYGDTDFVYQASSGTRFRFNMYRDREGVCAAIRQLPANIPTAEALALPEHFVRLSLRKQGLILVTGPTGSGKSTTLGALIDHINANRAVHILTLEDPIEFVHINDQAMVSQREVARDTANYGRGLRAGLRQDPDVILVGELRDLETVSLALEAANSGHLVLATMHTNSAPATIDRIISMFPAEQQENIRETLSSVLVGVLSQALAKKRHGGRVGVFEILITTPAVQNLIREHKVYQIADLMQTGGKDSGQLLQRSALIRLVKGGVIEIGEALS
ncbi:MAG: PilT/PilU family type 4a pilus ATPase, partial [Gammaproteobacteria bacterium]